MYKPYSLPPVGLAKSACGYNCEQLILALGHSEELFTQLKEKFGQLVDFEFLTEMGSWDTN